MQHGDGHWSVGYTVKTQKASISLQCIIHIENNCLHLQQRSLDENSNTDLGNTWLVRLTWKWENWVHVTHFCGSLKGHWKS